MRNALALVGCALGVAGPLSGCIGSGADTRPGLASGEPSVAVAGRVATPVPPPIVVRVATDEPTAPGADDTPVFGTDEAGPALLDDDLVPDVVRVVPGAFGDASVGGMAPSVYALEVVSGQTGARRKILRGEVLGEGSAHVQLVDLEGDGRPELLVAETGSYMTCDLGGGALTTRWVLVDAWGRVLYRSEHSELSYDVGGPARDGRVRASIVALGDGRSGVELRGPARRRVLVADGR